MVIAGLIVLLSSCANPKNWTYLQDMEYGENYPALSVPQIKLQPGDEVSIQVLSNDPLLAAPFNPSAGSTVSLDGTTTTAASSAHIYRVDPQGCIDFPVLGTLNIEGKTLKEVKDIISSKIIQLGYIKEPIVNVDMNNFAITVLNENGGSIINVGNGPINILQVIAQSPVEGQRSKIKDLMVIRSEKGVHTAYTVDLQKEELFNSPVFYLQQNDIVYLKPKGMRQSQSLQAWTSALTPIITLGSLVSNLMIWQRLIENE